MGSDMVVTLPEASANGIALFGLNYHADVAARHALRLVHGQTHDAGESIHLGSLQLPQARQTFSVLGMQPVGAWGYTHGVNEHRVAIGVTDWQSRLKGDSLPLGGPDLVRLALERARGALQAVEVLTDLLERHGNHVADGANDYIFLIADPRESFVLETAGGYWALLECHHTRVVTGAAMIRQDWRRLAPGLASYVIDKGWWRDDGSKIDFVRCLGQTAVDAVNAHKRWGHASLALAQQQGAIDGHFLRRMLADHYTQNRDLMPGGRAVTLASSLVVDLHRGEQPLVVWVAFGVPNAAVYFPLCPVGELPTGYGDSIPASPSIQQRTWELQKLAQGRERGRLTTALERLQTKFDQDADEYLLKAHDCLQHGKPYAVKSLAAEMMQSHVDLFDKEYRRLMGMEETAPQRVPQAEEVLFFA